MTQVSIKDQIRRLVELQAIDADIYELKSVLKEKPAQIEKLKNQYEEKKATLKTLEEKLKSIQVERKSYEVEMQAKEESIAKSNIQLSQLKTNKEYQAKISEIENIKADKSVIEEKILISYDAAEDIQKQINEEKIRLSQEEKIFSDGKKEAEEVIGQTRDKIKVLDAKREQALEGLEPDILARYERILDNRGGMAMVPVTNETCGGCYMTLPPQVINELKMHEKIIECESCARILYLADDL